MKKEITATLLVLGGSFLTYKYWNEKKESKEEISETRGGTIPFKTIGVISVLGGLYLMFKK